MKKIIFIALLLTLVSCKLVNRYAINRTADTFEISVLTNGDSEIVYLPMIHVSKPDFYAKIKRSVDSLRNLDYVIFYEGIDAEPSTSIEVHRVLWRKFRKVTGFFPGYGNEKLFKSLAINGFVTQNGENTGINVVTDVHADLTLNELIALYEKSKGEIVLSEYDLNTPLNERYKPVKINKENADFLIDGLRNDKIFKTVSESKSKKIAMVYGKSHIYQLMRNLKKQDSLWHYKPVWEIRKSTSKKVSAN